MDISTEISFIASAANLMAESDIKLRNIEDEEERKLELLKRQNVEEAVKGMFGLINDDALELVKLEIAEQLDYLEKEKDINEDTNFINPVLVNIISDFNSYLSEEQDKRLDIQNNRGFNYER